SHLHFDHMGGATFKREDGKIVPTFPKAKYIVQKGEWEAATNPDERSRGSYIADDFMPVADAKQIEFVNGDAEIESGIRVKLTGGHTKHHQAVIVESEGAKAIFLGCVMPTTKHIKPAYVMAYDLLPQEVVKARKELANWAVQENAICVWIHDPQIAAGYIRKDKENFTIEQVEAVRQ
ncbi:MBL fold metallo-hydrolase, partial [Candidatus Peregrinibacteria bacterium]|nr:MBL fold metallo-hydrolase [Candidatus Peregrinibacteria bacterium]